MDRQFELFLTGSTTTTVFHDVSTPSTGFTTTTVSRTKEELGPGWAVDDVYPPLAELRRALMSDEEWTAMSSWEKDVWELFYRPDWERLACIEQILEDTPAAQREQTHEEILEALRNLGASASKPASAAAASSCIVHPCTSHTVPVDTASSTIVEKGSEVFVSASTGFITIVPVTCSTDCSPQQSAAAPVLVASPPPTLPQYILDASTIVVAAAPLVTTGEFLAVLAPTADTPFVTATQLLQPFAILEHDANRLDIKCVPASAASSPQVHATLIVADTGNNIQVDSVMPFDPGRKLRPSDQALVAIPHASSEVCVLSGGLEDHEILNLDYAYNIMPTTDNQWSYKICSCGFFFSCHLYNMLLVDALRRIVAWEVAVTWWYKGRNIINVCAINFTMSWDPGEQIIRSDVHPNGDDTRLIMKPSQWCGSDSPWANYCAATKLQITDLCIMARSLELQLLSIGLTPEAFINCAIHDASYWPGNFVTVVQMQVREQEVHQYMALSRVQGLFFLAAPIIRPYILVLSLSNMMADWHLQNQSIVSRRAVVCIIEWVLPPWDPGQAAVSDFAKVFYFRAIFGIYFKKLMHNSSLSWVVLVQFSWCAPNPWSPLMLMVYTHWLLLEQVSMGVEVLGINITWSSGSSESLTYEAYWKQLCEGFSPNLFFHQIFLMAHPLQPAIQGNLQEYSYAPFVVSVATCGAS